MAMALGRRQNNNMAAAAREGVLNGMDHERRLVSIAFAASLVCHLLFFSIFIYTQTHELGRQPVQSVIQVSLVSLPEQAAPAQRSKPAETAPGKAEPEPSQEIKAVSTEPKQRTADVSLGPKQKVSLKKKTFKTEKVKKRALENLEKKVETTSSERIAEAIDRIKSKVENEEVKAPPKTDAVSGTQTGSVLGGEKEAGGKRAELIDIYRVEIAFQIQKNWAFPDQLAEGRTDLQTLLIFNVMPNGEIKDLFFTDRSGNKHFDESAYRAVMKSNPVAPHPRGISEPFVQMGLRFTPEGIR
jgi:colicin import membrane protein